MKKIKVKIKLSSIKENPDAGNTSTVIDGPKEIRFSCKVLPNSLLDGVNCHILDRNFNTEGELVIEGIITAPITDDFYKELIKDNKDFMIQVNSNPIEFNHAPIPKYTYKYKAPTIVCNNCGVVRKQKIKHDDRKMYYMCPVCGDTKEYKFVFESIVDALKRKLKTNK